FIDVQRINWTMADWCDQCHRKGGLVVWTSSIWTHFPDDLQYTEFGYPFGEALADLILGKIDCFEVEEMFVSCAPRLFRLYCFLNGGIRLPLVGSAHKYETTRALGQVRPYARIDPAEEFTYRAWIEAIRAGRTFVTNGPILTLEVNGHGPGAVVQFKDVPAKV